jgi:hypothetical protein
MDTTVWNVCPACSTPHRGEAGSYCEECKILSQGYSVREPREVDQEGRRLLALLVNGFLIFASAYIAGNLLIAIVRR